MSGDAQAPAMASSAATMQAKPQMPRRPARIGNFPPLAGLDSSPVRCYNDTYGAILTGTRISVNKVAGGLGKSDEPALRWVRAALNAEARGRREGDETKPVL